MTSAELRRDLSRRNLAWARHLEHETTFGETPSVVHCAQETGGHGNFLAASWRRIQARPAWRVRLEKRYTADARMARRHDRRRGELECATSSDALLMNLFCYPGLLRRPAITRLLGIDIGLLPSFGVRGRVPLASGATDRTEIDLRLGDVLLEAKLTETNFQTARPSLVRRYRDLDAVFDTDDLPRTAAGEFNSYQLIRNTLAAAAVAGRFAVVLDQRRYDLAERWFSVLRAVRTSELRSRLLLVTWQELAAACPHPLQRFLAVKYGIEPP